MTMRRDAQQLDLLKQTVNRVWNRVPLYRKRMEEWGVAPGDIRSLEDVAKLPLTRKADLRNAYPTGLLACNPEELVRFHASSGTTGKPTVVAYTAGDLEAWNRMMIRGLQLAGVTSRDVVQISYGYGLFTGGLGFHQGVEKLGATVIPASGGFSERQIMLMEDLGTTVLCCTPSYGLHLAEILRKQKKSLPRLRLGIFGAEPWTEGIRKRLEEELGILALDVYGLSEMMGPGVGMECPARQGLHLWDDHTLVEILHPETGVPLPPGEEGVLVLTSLTKEALPLLRYWTGDRTRILPGPCSCGTEGTRIERIRGRTDDMLILRGVNLFPSQIEVALGRVSGLSLHYLIEVQGGETLREVRVLCEASEAVEAGERKKLERLGQEAMHQITGLRIPLSVCLPGAIPRSEGKAQRVRRVA
ncbi:MAG TPA: phenylacetate--CoA ligase [Synergistaceae bacterium]|nr:phenylacetate--CoA ligase [Synergistaceae bacterium]